MKSEKGITLASLVIYVIITVMGVAILATIMAYFSRDVRDISKNNIEIAELDKFYSYFLQDVKKTNNDISEIAADNESITFTSGNTYSFSNETIFFNETIKLAENIDACTFTEGTQNGKTTITTAIIINDNTYTRTFVLSNKTATIAQVDEEDYVYHTLPAEYQRVDYLKSTGTQYIDTGVIGESGIKVDAELEFTEVTNDATILGSRAGNNRFYPIHSYPSKWCIGYGNYYSSNTAINKDTRYVIESELLVGSQSLKINNASVYSNTLNTNINTELNMFIFALNNGGTANYFTKFKLYSMTIYKNDVIIRNFVPCYRRSDEKPGLFDLVELKFYTNAGTSGDDFDVGPDALLPVEYQKVEYLESKGAQYIDSGTHLTLDTIIQCKFVYTATGSGYPTPYGCIQPSFGLYSNGGNGATVYTSFGSNYDVTYTGNLLDGPKTFIQNKDGVWVDGIKKVTYTNTTVTEDPNVHIYLFARMGNGTAAKFSKTRLYSFSILHGNNTVRNFVPCIRKTDSKPGLYDTVTGTFYTDAGTSGVDFDVGPDV